jgi:hypothetical protein
MGDGPVTRQRKIGSGSIFRHPQPYNVIRTRQVFDEHLPRPFVFLAFGRDQIRSHVASTVASVSAAFLRFEFCIHNP